MVNTETKPPAEEPGPFVNPWPFVGSGLAVLTLSSLILSTHLPDWASFLVLLAGLLPVACGVVIRPRSAAVLGAAALAALLGSLERQEAGWDSAVVLLRVLAVLASLAAILVLLPQTARRVAFSLFIVYHFAGILTAVTSAAPAWVPQQLWACFYRPYLEFMYLNNAYHFYAPEPGPAPLLWFRVEYERGKDGARHVRWVEVPDLHYPEGHPDGRPHRPDGSVIWPNLEYYRRLSLVESTSFPGPLPPSPHLDAIHGRRLQVLNIIPPRPDLPLNMQYRPPGDVAKRWFSVYARYVARTYKCESDPELKVTSVKIWRVIHEILSAGNMAKGLDPWTPISYDPYYMGEFDKDGELMRSCQNITVPYNGLVAEVPEDPFLYWLIPIMEVPKQENKAPEQAPGIRVLLHVPPKDGTERPEMEIINFVYVQTGDSDGRLRP